MRAQERNQAELKEYFLDAEYFFAQEEYLDALYDYQELYNSGFKDNANINYRIGICYLNIPGQKDKSIEFLLKAVEHISQKYRESSFKQVNAPADAMLYLGNAYRVNNLLSKAIESYNKFKELSKSPEEIKYTEQQITACQTAIRFMDNPLQIRFTNLGDSVNGNSSNFKAVISGDGKTLVYMTELPFYDAVYYSVYRNGAWSAPVNITPQIQSDGDQYASSISYDGTWLFLTKEDAFNSDIYQSRFIGGKWSRSEPVSGQNINTKFWESHASISRDGKTLYFTSNRKDGYGEMDIYKTRLQDNGQWGTPVNLGNVINTELNEDTPFISENDSLLYFSSQGFKNMGGYDIFVSRLNQSGQWTTPENVGYPINSTDDDLFYYPWHNARIGYVSLIRSEGYGKEDIYAVQPQSDKPLSKLIAELTEKQKPVAPETVAIQVTPEEPVQEKPPAPEEEAVETKPVTKEEPVVQKPVPLMPGEVNLVPVYFAFDDYKLTTTGKEALNRIVQLLRDYPSLTIKLIGNSDAKGSAEYNLRLSEKRALSALKYINEQGIEANRLRTIGLGETNFAAINSNPDGTDNPEGRRLNRRVEYEIIGTDNTFVIIRMPPIPDHLKIRE
jgi:outer membrane protein OmpA-like peptidoglycan-associated protein/tetratricopeptide (TPR) repeat protein